MRKMIIFLLFVCFNFMTLQGQSDSTYVKRALGVDLSFVNTFLPLDNAIGRFNGFLLYQRKYMSDFQFRRKAISGDIHLSNTVDDEIKSTRFRFNILYRVGKAKKVKLFDKFYAVYGVDHYLSFSPIINKGVSQTNSDRTTLERRLSLGYGLGGVLGIDYHINDKVTLFTELTYRVQLDVKFEQTKTEFSNRDADTNSGREFALTDPFTFPRTIVLYYHF